MHRCHVTGKKAYTSTLTREEFDDADTLRLKKNQNISGFTFEKKKLTKNGDIFFSLRSAKVPMKSHLNLMKWLHFPPIRFDTIQMNLTTSDAF